MKRAASGERPQAARRPRADGSAGLSVVAMPATRFVPEVPHARVQLDDVRLPADALLPGDGYASCVKPFRTIEDTHVTAAVLAYLLREARARDWPAEPARAVLPPRSPPWWPSPPSRADSPATHVVLEGALRWAHQLYDEAGPLWAAAADDAAARWQRDARAVRRGRHGARATRGAGLGTTWRQQGDTNE